METNYDKTKLMTNLAYAMELYWLKQLKKNNIVTLDEYYKIKDQIDKDYKKRG